MIWSIYDSPRLKGALTGPRVPKWLKRLQYWASDTLFVRPLLGEQLNGLRRDLGLRAGEASLLAMVALGDDRAWFVSRLVWPAAARLAAEHAAGRLSAVGRTRRGRAVGEGARVSRRRRRADRIFARLGQPRGASVFSRRPSRPASDSAGAASCSRSTPINCRPTCRDRCGTSDSCRSASCCRTRRRWCITAASARVRKVWRPACRTWCGRCRTISSTIRGDWCGWASRRKFR